MTFNSRSPLPLPARAGITGLQHLPGIAVDSEVLSDGPPFLSFYPAPVRCGDFPEGLYLYRGIFFKIPDYHLLHPF